MGVSLQGLTAPRASAFPRAVGRGPDVVTAGLQELFASIADEPIPDDFLRLLDEIDASAARTGGPRAGKVA